MHLRYSSLARVTIQAPPPNLPREQGRDLAPLLTTGWNLFDLTFTTSGFSGSSSDIRLQFWLSPYDAAGDVYWFDAIELTQAGSANGQTSRYGLAKALPAPRTQPSGTVRKYYYAGSTRVAMRENGTLYWLLSDHLGGTSITVSGTTETGEVRYYPWGNDRYTSGTTRTSFKREPVGRGQRRESRLGSQGTQ